MDKVAKYKKIVRQVTEEVGNLGRTPNDKIATQFITDDEHGHYLLYYSGWRDEESRTYGCFLHIDVNPDGKVWLQHDGTDLEVAKILVERGISKHDVVLGFYAPYRRAWVEDLAPA
jgi:hypothetical protein